jgi:hypothetical protein
MQTFVKRTTCRFHYLSFLYFIIIIYNFFIILLYSTTEQLFFVLFAHACTYKLHYSGCLLILYTLEATYVLLSRRAKLLEHKDIISKWPL